MHKIVIIKFNDSLIKLSNQININNFICENDNEIRECIQHDKHIYNDTILCGCKKECDCMLLLVLHLEDNPKIIEQYVLDSKLVCIISNDKSIIELYKKMFQSKIIIILNNSNLVFNIITLLADLENIQYSNSLKTIIF